MGAAAWAIALATVAVTLGGLGIVFSHAYDLVRPIYDGSTPVAGAPKIAGLMVAFGSATVLGVVALLIQLVLETAGCPSRVAGGNQEASTCFRGVQAGSDSAGAHRDSERHGTDDAQLRSCPVQRSRIVGAYVLS